MHAIHTHELETLLGVGANIRIVDVRKPKARENDPARIAGAVDRPFDDLESWANETENDNRVVICYCVHGHEVSQGAVQKLRDAGRNAFYLRGGLDAWKAESGALQLS